MINQLKNQKKNHLKDHLISFKILKCLHIYTFESWPKWYWRQLTALNITVNEVICFVFFPLDSKCYAECKSTLTLGYLLIWSTY